MQKNVAKKKTGARPKARSRSHNYDEKSSQSDEEQMDCTNPSGSQQTKDIEKQTRQLGRKKKDSQSIPDLDSSELKQLVSDCVYYLLIADQKKYSIKKTDIIKHVMKEHSKAFNYVMQQAKVTLKSIYGLNIVELESRKGQYMLFNRLDVESIFEGSDGELGQMGLVLIVLTLIFMNGNNMSEAKLWQALKKLGLDPNSSTPHPLFGDMKKLLTQELVKKLYLDYNRVQGTDPAIYEFQWGPRAKMEVEKLPLLHFVCNIYGKNLKPGDWTSQYQDAVQKVEGHSGDTNMQ